MTPARHSLTLNDSNILDDDILSGNTQHRQGDAQIYTIGSYNN